MELGLLGKKNGIMIAREEKWNYDCRETNGIRIAGEKPWN